MPFHYNQLYKCTELELMPNICIYNACSIHQKINSRNGRVVHVKCLKNRPMGSYRYSSSPMWIVNGFYLLTVVAPPEGEEDKGEDEASGRNLWKFTIDDNKLARLYLISSQTLNFNTNSVVQNNFSFLLHI